MSRPVPKPGILDIAPYTPGKSGAGLTGRVFKLSANETPLGPRPRRSKRSNLRLVILRTIPKAPRAHFAKPSAAPTGSILDHIICGAGSDEILNLLAHTYLGQGDEAIHTTHGFLVYPIATMANGADQRHRT